MSFIGKFQRTIGDISPWYLRQKNLGRFLESVGLTYDSAIETLMQGLRLGQPLRCDSSALPILGRDRGIKPYPTEAEESLRFRLSRWRQLHRQRGSHQGELRNTQPYFLPSAPRMRIVHQSGDGASATWHTLEPDGKYLIHQAIPSNWNYDSATFEWSRFWMIIYTNGTAFDGATRYDDGTIYNDGSTVYDGITAQAAIDLPALVRDWKAAHSRLIAVILTPDPAAFDPTAMPVPSPDGWTTLPISNWRYPIDPGTNLPTRLPTAAWIYDYYAQG